MKLNEPTGIFMQHEAISPEVERAQRMAELKNIAEYRASKLRYIQEWSDPVKRAKIQAEHAAAEKKARESLEGKYIDDYRVRTVKNEVFVGTLNAIVTMKPIAKPKMPWWERLLAWLLRQ